MLFVEDLIKSGGNWDSGFVVKTHFGVLINYDDYMFFLVTIVNFFKHGFPVVCDDDQSCSNLRMFVNSSILTIKLILAVYISNFNTLYFRFVRVYYVSN